MIDTTPSNPASDRPLRRVRSVTVTVRYADEPPTLAELVGELHAAADRLHNACPRQGKGGRG